VVGDVLLLQTGAVVPCDGIFLSGHGVVCNKSKDEGVPLVKKATIEHLIKIIGCSDRKSNEYSCFMHCGDKVLEGSCRYLVTAISDVAVIDNSVLRAFSSYFGIQKSLYRVQLVVDILGGYLRY
jgi:magnesium-transporting ATPase (P-type)